MWVGCTFESVLESVRSQQSSRAGWIGGQQPISVHDDAMASLLLRLLKSSPVIGTMIRQEEGQAVEVLIASESHRRRAIQAPHEASLYQHG
jgi:hypothetical protein